VRSRRARNEREREYERFADGRPSPCAADARAVAVDENGTTTLRILLVVDSETALAVIES